MAFVEGWRQRFRRHFTRRGPELRLGLRELYIAPTAFSLLWLAAGATLYLIGINSRSNGPLLLSLLLALFWLLAPFLTQFNLQGLQLRSSRSAPGFAGQTLSYRLQARSAIRRYAIEVCFEPLQPSPTHTLREGEQELAIPWQPQQRGWQQPGRLRIQSRAPLGLFRCWTYWVPPAPQLVWPRATPGPVACLTQPQGGADAFDGLQPLRPGEALQRVAWKPLAAGRGWHRKHFEADQPHTTWLAPAPDCPLETAIEHLCHQLLVMHQAGQVVGLVLPDRRIPPGRGERHLHSCLEALAQCPA